MDWRPLRPARRPGHLRPRFSASGSAIGDEFQLSVAQPFIGAQNSPALSVAADGTFVVAWMGLQNPGTDGYSIHAQRLDANAEKIGREFKVNTYTTGDQRNPSVGIQTDGSFVVVWHSDGFAVARRFNANEINLPALAPAATLLLDAGVDITNVQDLLGHKHVSVTQIYDKRRRSTKHSASHQVPL